MNRIGLLCGFQYAVHSIMTHNVLTVFNSSFLCVCVCAGDQARVLLADPVTQGMYSTNEHRVDEVEPSMPEPNQYYITFVHLLGVVCHSQMVFDQQKVSYHSLSSLSFNLEKFSHQ